MLILKTNYGSKKTGNETECTYSKTNEKKITFISVQAARLKISKMSASALFTYVHMHYMRFNTRKYIIGILIVEKIFHEF